MQDGMRRAWTGRRARAGAVEEVAGRLERRVRSRHGAGLPLLSIALFVAVIGSSWEAAILAGVSRIILPTPVQVAQAFGAELAGGDLLANAGITLQEALTGLALAFLIAAAGGYAAAHARPIEALVAPYIAASQAVPVIALAPLIILLLGSGLRAHAAVCAVVTVFPLFVTIVTGLRGIERDYRDVARVFGASGLQTLLLVELPLAAPVLLGGLKLALTLSITGAVVGEYVAADGGLGFMATAAVSNFEVAPRYVAIISLAVLGIGMYGLVNLLERIILRWQDD